MPSGRLRLGDPDGDPVVNAAYFYGLRPVVEYEDAAIAAADGRRAFEVPLLEHGFVELGRLRGNSHIGDRHGEKMPAAVTEGLAGLTIDGDVAAVFVGNEDQHWRFVDR